MSILFFIIAMVFLYLFLSTNKKLLNQTKELTKANSEIDSLNEDLNSTRQEFSELQKIAKDKATAEKELEALNANILVESINISDYDNITSEECKNKLVLLKNEYSQKVKNLDIVEISSDVSLGKKAEKNNIRQMLACFEAECQIIINNLTPKNADTSRGKIKRSFDKINSMFSTDGIKLLDTALEYKLNELSLVYAYIMKKEQEKEEQKAIREQMLEEEKVRREIERTKSKLEKEETQFKNEVSKLMSYMQKASDIEKQLYIDKIKELEEKLKGIEKDKENVLEREQNTRAGFVYVISNIGSFGDDVYKIGMTRRLEPMDRINELGSASVPFEFDVHAMIFSEDAPTLENILHNTFKKYQVNKVNPRKEFFKVPLDEIEKVVKENHNATVHFTKIAEATQYRESLKMSNS